MRDYLILILLACLFFFPFLGGVHLFDWDEINFAESAREMLVSGDFFRPQVDYEPFWEKPPLFIWFQALSMQLWGVGEYAARFPNAVCGLLTLLVVFKIGSSLFDRIFGWFWAMAWLGSILPHLYFKSGIIDPWFNLFIFLGIYGFIRFRWQFFSSTQRTSFWVRYRYLIIGGLLLGLAILTKGPVAFIVTLLTVIGYWARYKFKGKGFFSHIVLFSLAACCFSLLWFGMDILLHGTWFMQEFLTYQVRLFSTKDAGHGGFWGYHIVVLLLGCFPASVFALPNLWGDKQPDEELMCSNTLISCQRCDFTTWMQILFWVVLVLFSIVQTKIVHYSSLCYFPLTFLGALTIWRAMNYGIKPRFIPVLLPILGVLMGLIVVFVPYLGKNIHLLKPLFQKDAFALGNLDAAVHWHYCQGIPGLILITASVLGSYYWVKNQVWKGAEIMFVGGMLFTSSAIIFLVNNIEAYSQNAAIEFYESKQNEDCFVKPYGFKSFAHLFYARKQMVVGDKKIDDFPNILEDDTEKTVYFVAKCTNTSELQSRKDCKELYRKNGFVFYKKIQPKE